MAAANAHPDLNTSLILIGAALAFTVDNWDEFAAETEMEDGGKDLKEAVIHLMGDINDQVTDMQRMERIVAAAKRLLFNL